jgi:type VI secretion system protein ImpK
MTRADSNEALDAGREQQGSRPEGLALLYQGLLTAIVRIQSGKQQIIDASSFQKRMEGLLDEIEREAIRVGYRNQDIRDAHYATIAFLDETIRRSDDPNRGRWSPLEAKRYAQAVAGEGVYARLETIRARRDSTELADLLEVYLLCLLLGYQGRYAEGAGSEQERLIEDLRGRIERIRGRRTQFSPDGTLRPAPQTSTAPLKAFGGSWKIIAISCLAIAFFAWIVLKLILVAYAKGALSEIQAL